MFIGHYGPAVWDTQRGHGKPLIKLWEAFLAVQAMDLVAGVMVMFSIEGTRMVGDTPIFHVPWSHSLLSSIVIAIAAGLIYKLFRKHAGRKEFIVIALLAFSHWVLDLIVHRPDLPLYPGAEDLYGFALWNFPWIAFALEAGLLAGAFLFWQKVTTPKNKKYDYAIWALFLFMCVAHYFFIVEQGLQINAGTFDPNNAPPDMVLGVSFLVVISLFAFLISLIEKGRPSKFATD